MTEPRRLGPAAHTLTVIAYLMLILLGFLITFLTLGIMGFMSRDSFCHMGYISHISTLFIGAAIVATPMPLAAAGIAAWRLRGRARRWTLAFAPVAALLAAGLMLWGAVVTQRLANDAHCAAGVPEMQDNSLRDTPLSTALGWASLAAALAAPLSAGVAFSACSRAPRREARP